jgi:hypothetical protein
MTHTHFPEVPDFLVPLVDFKGGYPQETIKEIILRREEATPHLLASVEWMLEYPQVAMDEEDNMLPFFALYLLAMFREPRAKDLILRLARHPLSDDLLGDVTTMGLNAILASVCMDDPDAIKSVVEDPDAYEFARASAVDALATLCLKGKLTRESLSQYLSELYQSKLEKEPSFVWDGAVGVSVDLGFPEHRELIKQAYLDGLADPMVDRLEHVLESLESSSSRYNNEQKYRFVADVDSELSHWYCFSEKYLKERERENSDRREVKTTKGDTGMDSGYTASPWSPPETYVRPQPKIGRNDPCPCGSGKKYKKCCGA